MAIVWDRLKASIYSLVRAATSRHAYAAPRFARVVKATTASDGSTTLDVVPDDPTFPPMAALPLFHGLPGVSIDLNAGTRVLVEFSEADPAKPFVRSWAGGEDVAKVSIGAGATPVALAQLVNQFNTAISTHTHPVAGVQVGSGAVVSGPSVALSSPPDVSAQVVSVA